MIERRSTNTLNSTNDIYLFNTSTSTYSNITTKLPGNAAFFASNYICHNESIYMFGPATDDNSADGKVWIFDIVSQKLTDISVPSDAD